MTKNKCTLINLKLIVFTIIFISSLAACNNSSDNSSDNNQPDLSWNANIYHSASRFAGYCNSVAENFWLRSIFNEFYFWYEDIVDANPHNFLGVSDHFDYLITNDITPSGKRKDEFSFLADAFLLDLVIQQGIEIGYGMRLTIKDGEPDEITVAFVAPGSPAAIEGIGRGDKIIGVDNFTFSPQQRDAAYDALYPFYTGETHTLSVEPIGGGSNNITINSAAVAMPATDNYQIIDPSGTNIGYLQFNDHTAVAEPELIAAFQDFETANINELILDLRYNSGGILAIANQVSYMIAGSAKTISIGANFETVNFNNHFAPENIPFESTGYNNTGSLVALPTLDLNRVVIISGADTCSASESIINGLRGVGVDVVLIGQVTCGKPFGFVAFYNCGIAYLPVLFQGENNLGFGDYADGFKPNNASNTFAEPVDGGCEVADDFSKPLGDISEARLSAALNFINSDNCPIISSSAIATSNSIIQSGVAVPKATKHPVLFRQTHGLRILEN